MTDLKQQLVKISQDVSAVEAAISKQAIEFSSEQELEHYLKKHPKADRRKHTVREFEYIPSEHGLSRSQRGEERAKDYKYHEETSTKLFKKELRKQVDPKDKEHVKHLDTIDKAYRALGDFRHTMKVHAPLGKPGPKQKKENLDRKDKALKQVKQILQKVPKEILQKHNLDDVHDPEKLEQYLHGIMKEHGHDVT